MATVAEESWIKRLCNPDAYEHVVTDVQLLETHISWVFLAGEYAYKLKKPVNFGFLDFSSLDKRQFYCDEELRLNRRFAPELYLDVVAVTGSFEHPLMGGDGEPLEYAVRMHRFDSEQLLDRLAGRGELHSSDIDQIARLIADFHRRAAPAEASSSFGDASSVRHWCDENIEHIRPLLNTSGQRQQLERLEDWARQEWQSRREDIQYRRQEGFVRECHGDLHLGNMVRIDGRVTLFDCIEFNPQLRWIDVLSEVAFLYMDLLHRGLNDHAHRFLNNYLQHCGDYAGLLVFRYYLVYRAMVRAKVALLRFSQEDDERQRLQEAGQYQAYADLAEESMCGMQPAVLITHGFSGSGKSTFASRYAETTGAIQLRSDIERKRLFGYANDARTGADIGQGIYNEDAGIKTYERLAELAAAVVAAGFAVIVDAAFLKHWQRKRFQALAVRLGVAFRILDLKVDEAELFRRVGLRQQQGTDASEATSPVLQQQLDSAEPFEIDELASVSVLDAGSDQEWGRQMKEITRAISE